MSGKLKATLVGVALAGTAAGLVPAHAAEETPPPAATITRVSPAKASSTGSSGITITGKELTEDITKVTFTGTNGQPCPALTVLRVSDTKIVVTTGDCGGSTGAQQVQLLTDGDTVKAESDLSAARTVTFVDPVAVQSISPRAGLTGGGQVIRVEMASSIDDRRVLATLTQAPGKAKPLRGIKIAADGMSFTATVPSGSPGAAVLGVSVDSALSPQFPGEGGSADGFTYVRGIKVAPAFSVVPPSETGLSTPPKPIKLTGTFGTSDTFTVCGEPAEVATPEDDRSVKTRTAKVLWIKPPAPSAVGVALAEGIVAGKVCDVQVTGDDGASAITKDSTFTYSAF